MTYEINEPDFSTWLKHILNQTEIKPSSLTKAIEIDRTTVYQWLSGRRILKDVTSRIRLAKILSEEMQLDYREIMLQILWSCHVSEVQRAQ